MNLPLSPFQRASASHVEARLSAGVRSSHEEAQLTLPLFIPDIYPSGGKARQLHGSLLCLPEGLPQKTGSERSLSTQGLEVQWGWKGGELKWKGIWEGGPVKGPV